ncbi:hypothetical protein ACN27F_23295 [Solwaraspora sp. WMMB335]|uniref:hypothetical protein n=1 Tax=Solwaraspora sp. WMMB335 TaxID=3404118 RepID=UPI003B94F538
MPAARIHWSPHVRAAAMVCALAITGAAGLITDEPDRGQGSPSSTASVSREATVSMWPPAVSQTPASATPSLQPQPTADPSAAESQTADPGTPADPDPTGESGEPGGGQPASGGQTATESALAAIGLVGAVSMISDPGQLIAHVHTLPTQSRAGDLILAAAEVYEAEPLPVPARFAPVATATGGDRYRPELAVFWKRLADGERTIEIGFADYTAKTSAVAVYRGVDTSTPIVAVTTAFNNGSATMTAPGLSASSGSRLVMVVAVASNEAPAPWTGTPGGMTRRAAVETAAWRGMIVYDQTVSAGSTGTRTATRAAGAHQATVLLALRPRLR